MRVWLVSLVVIAAAACTHGPARPVVALVPRPPHTAHQGPPAPAPHAQSWAIGQWVEYQVLDGATVVSQERFQVLAQDECGFWFERYTIEPGQSESLLYCIHAPPPPSSTAPLSASLGKLIIRRNNKLVDIVDFAGQPDQAKPYDELVARVVAPWEASPPTQRTDITVPDGSFDQALEDATATHWFHPAIPLGGLVREKLPGTQERVLVDHGDKDDNSGFVDLATDLRAAQSSRRVVVSSSGATNRGSVMSKVWIGVSIGAGGVDTSGEVHKAADVMFVAAVQLGRRFDLVLLSTLDTADAAVDPMLSENLDTDQLGLRWYPDERAQDHSTPPWPFRYYLQASLGYSELSRSTVADETKSTVGRGGVARVVGGIETMFLHSGWVGGLELYDQWALLNAGEGTRHSFGLAATINLLFQ